MANATIVMRAALASEGTGRSITMVRALLAALVFCAIESAPPLHAQLPSVVLSIGSTGLMVSQATAGSGPHGAIDDATRVTLNTLESSDLLASLDAPLPAGLALRVKVQAPAGAVSMGFVTLDVMPQEVVRGIAPGLYPSLTITYELVAQTQAGTVLPSSCAVSFSLAAGS